MATKVGVLADDVGFKQRAYLTGDSKKTTGNGFTVANPNPASNNGGATMPMAKTNVGTASVQQGNQYTGLLNAYGAASQGAGSFTSATPGVTPLNRSAADMKGMLNAYALGGVNNTGGATGGGSTGGAGQQPAMMFAGDYAEKANTLLTQLETMVNKGFSYDYKTDPAYLAAVQQASKGAKLASDNTLQTMSDRGILNSSVASSQLGQIEQEAQSKPLELIPGLENNAYNRYQNNINNQSDLVRTMLGQMNSDRAFNADQSWREADVTGTYESPEFKKLFDSVIGAKQGWSGANDPAARSTFAQQGVDARAAMAALTGRSPAEIEKMFGSGVGVDAALANYGMGGTQTMTAKRYGVEDQRYKDETTYKKEQDKAANTLNTNQFNETVRHNKATEGISAARGSGRGSGGLSFNELLKSNTNSMLTTMLGEIKSIDEVPTWIKANSQAILQAGVDPVEFYDAAKKFYSGASPANKPLSGLELSKMALDAAQKDPAWSHARDDAAKQAIIQRYHDYFSQAGGGVAGGGAGGGDPLDGLLALGEKFFPNLFKSKYQPPVPTGGGVRAVHTTK